MSHDNSGDSYVTIAREVQAEITVRRSRFKACIKPISTESDAEEYLKSIKDTFHNAAHHCYAFIITNESGLIIRSSDAGEPSGTAGKPILTALQGYNLSNVICVVVRYFGGTKLGTGNLARAYAGAADTALQAGEIVAQFFTSTVRLTFPYEMTGKVERLLATFDADVIRREFAETSCMECGIRKNLLHDFLEQFLNMTRGRGSANTN